MEEQQNDIRLLIKKYNEVIEGLEKQLSAATHKRDVVFETIKLLEQEGILMQEKMFKTPALSVGGKYQQMRMKDATIDIFNSYSEKYLTGKEIYNELMKNGFQSNSKNIQRDVYIMLYKLKKDNKLIENTEGKLKRYKLKK